MNANINNQSWLTMKAFKWYVEDFFTWVQYQWYTFWDNAFRLKHKDVTQMIIVLMLYDALFNHAKNTLIMSFIFIIYLGLNSINSGHHRNWKRVRDKKNGRI